MKQIQRQAIVVWMYTLKPMKQIKRFGHIQYVSKRLKYIYLYVNKDQVENVMDKISGFHFVRKVEISPRADVRMDFSQILPELRAEIEQSQDQAVQ